MLAILYDKVVVSPSITNFTEWKLTVIIISKIYVGTDVPSIAL